MLWNAFHNCSVAPETPITRDGDRAHPTEGLWHCVIPEGEPVAPFHGLDMVAMVPSNFVSDMLKCSL